jgi:hypothetical protein
MYKIEKIGKNVFYIKALGTMPPSVAKKLVEDFKEKIENLENISSIVDGLDLIILNLKSFKIILDFLKELNPKLIKAAYVIGKSPVLNKEAEILLERAKSPNRKIVKTLEEAKQWIGIEKIIFKKE